MRVLAITGLRRTVAARFVESTSAQVVFRASHHAFYSVKIKVNFQGRPVEVQCRTNITKIYDKLLELISYHRGTQCPDPCTWFSNRASIAPTTNRSRARRKGDRLARMSEASALCRRLDFGHRLALRRRPSRKARWCELPVTIHWQWRDYLRMRSGRDSRGESAHFTPRRDPPIARLAAGRRRINDSRPFPPSPRKREVRPFRTFGPMYKNRDFCNVGTFQNGAIRL